MTDRRIGSAGARVEIVPPMPGERWLAGVGINVDFQPVVARAVSTIGLMVEYVTVAVATNIVRWSGLAFEMGTSSPTVFWDGAAFAASGTATVVWQDDHFELAT